MKKKELQKIIDEIDLSSLRINFQIIHSHYFDEELNYNLESGFKSLRITFRVQGRFFETFKLDDLHICDTDFWLNDETEYILNDKELTMIEKELITQIKDF